MAMREAYILLSDDITNSRLQPIGVGVVSEEEADKFLQRPELFGRKRAYAKVLFFDTAEEAARYNSFYPQQLGKKIRRPLEKMDYVAE